MIVSLSLISAPLRSPFPSFVLRFIRRKWAERKRERGGRRREEREEEENSDRSVYLSKPPTEEEEEEEESEEEGLAGIQVRPRVKTSDVVSPLASTIRTVGE